MSFLDVLAPYGHQPGERTIATILLPDFVARDPDLIEGIGALLGKLVRR